jgi:hypothetical protein
MFVVVAFAVTVPLVGAFILNIKKVVAIQLPEYSALNCQAVSRRGFAWFVAKGYYDCTKSGLCERFSISILISL